MTGWTARELARSTGISASTLILWIAKGLVTPESCGRGRNGHLIGLSGLLELLTIIELRQAGISLQAITRAIENLRQLSGEARPMGKFLLVVRGKDIIWSDEDSLCDMTFSALQSPGQRLMVFPVGQQHIELAQHLQSRTSAFSSNPPASKIKTLAIHGNGTP